MKSLAVCVFSLAVLTAVSSIDPAAMKNAMSDVRKCIKANKLKPEVAYSFMSFDFDEPSEDLKCLINCLVQNAGAIDESGDLNKERVIELVESFAPELESQALDIWETCATVPKVADLCEYSFQLTKCVHEQCIAKAIL